MNNNHEINLEFNDNNNYYCTFNLKGEFILYTVANYYIEHTNKRIWIYSTQTKNNKWKCKNFTRCPKMIDIQQGHKIKI